ncbi:YchF/TatD family DNA exonuclease [Shewanella inventionis]|uniref:DNAse n=1 Tax=Shewanella inventionis TaxID=1738770 RepID=A0ABQ1ISC7_9GAMM|nr:YchF/TatD family DNA exonuclease [Shewanella inventionis]MCL1157176.1 YchF/TatD family DNA exonuclease [Shewanella inventionis]UAL41964.1 YchF/TatD family DNA exonuclease [Shewanella inventionis]GGB49252.1 DNAse [Shewanella inventionis]
MLIDSHCHLDRLKAAPDLASLQTIMDNAKAQGVDYLLCVNVRQQGFEAMRDKVASFENVFLSSGVHPLDVQEGLNIDDIKRFASDPRVVAIGETGLDYFYSNDTKALQQSCFEQQIALAVDVNKPLIVHTRDAREDTINMLKSGHADKVGGVLHCFTENWEMAKAAIDLGFYISVSGIVTFKNAGELRSVIRKVPKDRLLVETDSPYLAPVPHRGQENQPAYVRDVAQFVAELRGETFDDLAQYTTDNFFNLFKDAAKLIAR